MLHGPTWAIIELFPICQFLFFRDTNNSSHTPPLPWLFFKPCEKYIFSVAINTQLDCYQILLYWFFSSRMMQNFCFLKSNKAANIKTYFLCRNLSATFLQKEKNLKIYTNILFSQLALILY